MVQLAGGLRQRGHAVDLVLATAAGPYLSELDPGVDVVDLGKSSVRAAVPGLIRTLRERRPFAALSTLPHSNVGMLIAAKLARVGTRVFLREATTPTAVSIPPTDIRERAMRRMLEWAYRAADGVIAVSGGVADDLTANLGIPASKVHTIYNPVVDQRLFELAAADVPDHKLGLETEHVVLAVGRLIADKDYPTQLRALALARKEVDAGLLILGEGPERPALEALVASLRLEPYVRMPGFVTNPFAYMSRASVFALSSVREGLPGVLIQALACGCPVVATNCRSGPAEVLDGGAYGALVPVGDETALAAAMLAAIGEEPDRDRLVRRSLDFTVDASVTAYERLLLQAR